MSHARRATLKHAVSCGIGVSLQLCCDVGPHYSVECTRMTQYPSTYLWNMAVRKSFYVLKCMCGGCCVAMVFILELLSALVNCTRPTRPATPPRLPRPVYKGYRNSLTLANPIVSSHKFVILFDFFFGQQEVRTVSFVL